MTISTELYTQTSQSISNVEYSLTANSTSIASLTTAAVVTLWLDAPNMQAGDEFEVAIREKVVTGGTQRRMILANLVGVQAEPFVTGPYQVGIGWDLTLLRKAGSDRAFSWSIRSIN